MTSPANDLNRQYPTLQRIDILCDEFEAAWQRGERPAVEEMLSRGSAEERRRLCVELVQIDIDYRRKRGEQPQPADYAKIAGWDDDLARQVNDDRTTPIRGQPNLSVRRRGS